MKSVGPSGSWGRERSMRGSVSPAKWWAAKGSWSAIMVILHGASVSRRRITRSGARPPASGDLSATIHDALTLSSTARSLVANSSSARTGFDRKSSMLTARQLSRAFFMTRALSAMIGKCPPVSLSRSRIACETWKGTSREWFARVRLIAGPSAPALLWHRGTCRACQTARCLQGSGRREPGPA
jgi:hypothetical protein